ncbi:unnamed protein product, partial [Staurois parvus]
CPIIGVRGGGIVPHHWCQWGGGEYCPIIGVSGGGGIVPHHWCQWGGGGNSAPSLVSVGGRNSAPSLVSVGGEE